MSVGRRIANFDPRDQPAYPLGEAARYLRLPAATLRAWTLGRSYSTAKGQGRFRPLIRPAAANPPTLSFWDLIQAHVLRALRSDHGVSIQAVRKAIDFAQRELDIDRLLLRRELSSDAGQLFLERYGQLINLSASGQLAMRQVLAAHLRRVTWDEARLPIRLHPFLGEATSGEMPIAIDPGISFGRPVVLSVGVSTAAIAARIDAGEALEDVAHDYALTIEDIEQAVVYERAA
jgi:uncharacterized protein (DUF433 family)/DNA-binding transcriptional MerR regulator